MVLYCSWVLEFLIISNLSQLLCFLCTSQACHTKALFVTYNLSLCASAHALANQCFVGIGYKKRCRIPLLVMCEANGRVNRYSRPLVINMVMNCSILVMFSFRFRIVPHCPHAPHVYWMDMCHTLNITTEARTT